MVARMVVGHFDAGKLGTKEGFEEFHDPSCEVTFKTPLTGVPYYKDSFKGTQEVLGAINTGMFSQFDFFCNYACATEKAQYYKLVPGLPGSEQRPGVEAAFVVEAAAKYDPSVRVNETWKNVWYFTEQGKVIKAVLDWSPLSKLFPWLGGDAPTSKIDRVKAAVGSFSDGSIKKAEIYLMYHHPDMTIEFTSDMYSVPYFQPTYTGIDKIIHALNDVRQPAGTQQVRKLKMREMLWKLMKLLKYAAGLLRPIRHRLRGRLRGQGQ